MNTRLLEPWHGTGDLLDVLAPMSGISKQSSMLSHSIATQEVVAALNEDLKLLNVRELKAGMKAETARSKTQYKLVLKMPGNMTAINILSEGEQRANAIDAFLAEVNLGAGLCGVVFDSAVSPLDHRRRWHAAKRLAQEALKHPKTAELICFFLADYGLISPAAQES